MQSTADLGVVVGGENLSVTGLALVSPAVGLSRADTVKAGKSRDLAEPATDEDVLEVVGVTGGKDLAVGAWVELVDHLAVGRDNCVHGVGLELGVVGKSLQAQLSTPFVNNALVTGSSGRRSGGSRGGSGLGAGRSRRSGSLGGLVRDLLGAGGNGGVRLVDHGGGHSRGLVDGSGGLGGLRLLLALGVVHSVNDSLVNDVNVLDLLVLRLGPVGGCESSAGKGEDGSRSAHFDGVGFEVGSELTG